MYVQIVIPQARVLCLIYTPRGHHMEAPTNIVLIKIHTHMHTCTHIHAYNHACNMRCCLIDDQQSLVLDRHYSTTRAGLNKKSRNYKTNDQDSKSVTDYTHTVC